MFPNPDDTPAILAQNAIHPAIPGFVRRELSLPEYVVVRRGVTMSRTAVPETAIHKNGYPDFTEYKVRLPEYGQMPPPAGDVVMTK